MALQDLIPPGVLAPVAGERAAVARITGCPRCGSVCRWLDACRICLGEAPCARCLFGPRVEDDEVHATLVPDE